MYKAVIASCLLAMAPVAALAAGIKAPPAKTAKKIAPADPAPVAPLPVDPVPANLVTSDPTRAGAPAAETAAEAPAPVLLSDSMQAYAIFQQDVTELRGFTIKTAKDVDKALSLVARHNPTNIGQGYYSYLAVIAAQDPVFAADVRKIASEFGREKVIQTLPSSVRYIRESAKGANQAAQLVLRAASADSARLLSTSERYREFSLALQKQAWAKRPIGAANKVRLVALRKAEAAPSSVVLPLTTLVRLSPSAGTVNAQLDPSALGGTLFWDALGSKAEVAVLTSFVEPKVEVVTGDQIQAMDRVLTLAALYVLDAQKDNPAGIAKLLSDGNNAGRCLAVDRSAFYSAVSASQFQYESVAAAQAHLVSYAKCLDAIRLKPAA